MKKNKGFTLIELLAVIVIIGILSVIAIVSVSRLISKSKNEQLKQQKNTIAMAAESYMQSNRVFLPKSIGQSTEVSVQTLRDKGYIKEDIKNADGQSCMSESYVKVYKASATKYKYTTYLYCGNEHRPAKDEVEKPSITIQFLTANGDVITSENDPALNDVSVARFKIIYKGGTSNSIEIDGYSYAILVDTDTTSMNYKEVYNSGTLSGNGNTMIVVEKYITDYLDITKETKVKIRATAINKKGGVLDETIAVGEDSPHGSTTYNDKVPPICTSVTNQAGEGDWINKKKYEADSTLNTRQIVASCDDGNGSGCIRSKFTKTFPNQEVKSIEYGYVTVVDNAGNVSTPIVDDSINSSNICDVNIDLRNRCLARINVDVVAPTIKLDAFALNANGSIKSNTSVLSGAQTQTNSNDKATITYDKYKNLHTSNTKWMNATNYPGGVIYKVKLHDDLHLVSWKWETNPAGIAYGSSDYNTKYSSFSTNNADGAKGNIADDNTSVNCGKRDYDITIKFTKNGLRRGRLTVTDKAGNVATYIIEANIDTTIPKVPNVTYKYVTNNAVYDAGTGSGQSPWTNKVVKNHVKTTGDVGVSGFSHFAYKYYKNNRKNSSSKKCTKNDYDCFKFEDEGTSYTQYSTCNNAGNCSSYSDASLEKAVKYDKTAPTGMVVVGNNGAVKSGDWTGGPNVASLVVKGTKATDNLSGGVYYIYGSNANVNPIKGKNSYTRSAEGNETVYFKACDIAGNCSPSSPFVIKIDRTKPGCTSSGGNSNWTNGSRTIKGVCNDKGGSPCREKIIYNTINENMNSTTVSPGRVYDKVGNYYDCPATQTVKIDKTKPTCTSSGGSSSWTNGNRTLTGTCHDKGGSGCPNISKPYKKNINSTKESPGTVRDGAGNTAACPADQTVRIDKTDPGCSWSGTSTSWAKSRTVTLKPTDSGSGPDHTTDKSWSYSSGTVVYKNLSGVVKDKAGNKTTCTKNNASIYIDNDPPYKIGEGDTAIVDCSGGNYRRWLQFKDSGSGIDYRHITTSRGLDITTYQGGQAGYFGSGSVDECMMSVTKFTYTYEYCDVVGNCKSGSGSR